MHETSAPTPVIHFGVFEVDLRAGDLRKQGLKIKLHGQPMEVLAMLLEHPGEVVTREEIHHRLWPGNTFVDFEHSINTAIKKLREALGDDADKPRYIETLPRKGYRFVYPVAAVSPIAGPIGIGPSESENRTPPPGTAPPRPLTPGPSPAGRGEEGVTEGGRSPTGRGETVSAFQPSPTGRGWPTGTGEGAPHPSSGGYTRRVVRALVDAALDAHRAQTRWQRLALVGIAAAALAVGLAVLVALNVAGLRERIVGAGLSRQDGGDVKSPLPKIESIAVLPLENLSHDPEQDYFADGMT
ncbi:MAG: winged helix-turn-helix domain-containing protein, partial [Terriglobia bacterium]